MTIVTNPDQQKKFKVWHFCGTCLLRWKADDQQHKTHIHNDIRTVSTDKPFVIVCA